MKTIKQTIMAKNIQHVSHIKSKQIVNGRPKLPNASSLVEGEIAINFAEGVETISTKNESGNVVTFSSDNYYTEQKLGSGFTDENSGRTVTEALDEKVNVADVISAITPSNSGSTNPIATSVVAKNEKVVSEALINLRENIEDLSGQSETVAAALNELDSRKLDASAYTPTDLSNYYTKDETSGKTELSTAFNAKADTATTLGGYGITDAYTKSETSGSTELADAFNSVNTSIEDLSGQSETVAVALNVLKDEKLDASAYTPTDLSNYYTKSETSGATELSTAFNTKADNNSFTAHTADTNIHVSSNDKTNWNGKFDDAKYEDSGTTKVINFYSGNIIKATIDASDFIKDGMVDSVTISGGNLVITFNTDSGKQPISIPLTDIFNPSNYYTKSETSGKTELSTAFSSINASITDLSGQSETVAVALNTLNEKKLDASAYTPTDLSDYYKKSETSGKTEISNALGAKVNSTTFTAHTANTTMHITSSERTSWNNKVNASDVVTAITPSNSGSTNPIATSVVAENEKVVSNALVSLDERITDLTSQVEKLIETTYSNLKTLRDGGNLVAGQFYRITDYVTTTVQEDTQSAGHQFDIIVVADSANKLNENARAIQHAGDTYFSNSKLEAWELKYCLDNDTDRFAWADTTNGKGVIYWMKDEFFNECGYDFKNIQFARYKITAMEKVPDLVNKYSGFRAVVISGQGSLYPLDATIDSSDKVYHYTFNLNSVDYSLIPRLYGCHENVIEAYKPEDNQTNRERQFLNNITFANTSLYIPCYGNKFESRCNSMTFGNNCYSNTFGNNCYSNTFGNNCTSNTFGNTCYSNTFGGYCYSNTFGNTCGYNTFGNTCYSNTFGNNCGYNTFGNTCYSNTFGSDCFYIRLRVNYCKYIKIENGNKCIDVTSTSEISSDNYLRNITIEQGFNTKKDVAHTKTIVHNSSVPTIYRHVNTEIILDSNTGGDYYPQNINRNALSDII